jgi:hypothetical protein
VNSPAVLAPPPGVVDAEDPWRSHNASHQLTSETSPFLALPNGTSDILVVALRTQLLGGAAPEPSHKSQVRPPAVFPGEEVRASLEGALIRREH